MDTYVYTIGSKAYINLTNKCSNSCEFCIRTYKDGIKDYKLWLQKEPSAEEVKELLGDVKQYEEVVFCGFGEPMYRLDDMREIGLWVKSNGGATRVNTNGQGLMIAGDDAIDKLVGAIDIINVSLNAPTESEYNAICHPIFPNAFSSLLEFTAKCAKANGFKTVRMSVMEQLGEQKIAECKKLAESLGATLFVREMEK